MTPPNIVKPSLYVILYRVSTKGQGDSGLGLDAQKRDAELFLNDYADQPTVIAEFVEIESGKLDLDKRPTLKKAIELCTQHNATLLISKLDRLSRRVSVISHLMEIVTVKVASMPLADNFQLHIFAALAEQEREFISKRTKAALAAAKARGVKLGGTGAGIKRAVEVRQQKANDFAQKLSPIIVPMFNAGISMSGIARSLNAADYKTPRGKNFTDVQVSNMLARLGAHKRKKQLNAVENRS